MSTLVRPVLWTLALLAALAVTLAALAPWLAERMLFLPDRSDPGAPPALSGISGEDVPLVASDGVRLHAWWWEAAPGAPVVLLLHGNAGHVGDRIPLAAGLVERGISVMLLDYRGYGRSEGRPHEGGLLRDAAAGLTEAAERAGGPERVVLFGRSMGGAVAVRLAAEAPVGGVMLEATFVSLEGIARSVYPFLPRFVTARLRGRYDALGQVGRVRAPVLVVHGTRDRIVPSSMGRALVEAAAGRAEWYAVEGAGHNDPFLVGGAGYFDRLAAFVQRAAGGADP